MKNIFLLLLLTSVSAFAQIGGGITNNYGPSIVSLTTSNNYIYANGKRILTSYDVAEFYNGLMTSTDRTNWDGKWTPGTAADGGGLTNISTANIVGLVGADTNAMVRSPRSSYWTTNALNLTNAAIYQIPVTVTNPESLSYTVLAGQPDLYWSPAGSTNWTIGGITTNAAISFMFLQSATPSVKTPTPPVITNLTIYTLSRPDLFGRTNPTYGQTLEASDPVTDVQVATKRYVDNKIASVSFLQNGGIYLSTAALNLNSEWTESAGTNGLAWRYLGVDALRIENPSLNYATITSIKMTNTVVWLTIWTNGVTSLPAPQWTFDLTHPQWATLSGVTNTYPTPGGTNYTISFQSPNPTNAFLRVAMASALPNIAHMTALLQSTPRTVTNSTDSTFGQGAGVVTWDTNYLYISVGTNVWKRTTLSTW